MQSNLTVYFVCTSTNCKNWKFLPWKKAKKKMLRQADFWYVISSMTFKLSIGKNSAWFFFIPCYGHFLTIFTCPCKVIYFIDISRSRQMLVDIWDSTPVNYEAAEHRKITMPYCTPPNAQHVLQCSNLTH